MKIAFCVVSRDMCHSAFAFDLANAMICTNCAGHSVALVHNIGTGIAGQRETTARDALAAGADWLFWVDSDMRFPPDAALRLLSHKRDVVGCNYSTRAMPPEPTAKTLSADRRVWSALHTDERSSGLAEVSGMGFGCILISARVFKGIKDNKDLHQGGYPPPWFIFQWSTVNGQQLGEDLFWCDLAVRSGFKLHVDHDLSKLIKHIGSFEYSLDHVQAIREQEAA